MKSVLAAAEQGWRRTWLRAQCRWFVVTTPPGFKEALQAARSTPAGRRLSAISTYWRWARACRSIVGARLERDGVVANMAFGMYPGLAHGAYEAIHEHGTRRAEANLSAQAGQRRMDRHDEPDRAALRHRSGPACAPRPFRRPTAPTRSPARRFSSPAANTISPSNIIHLVLARIEGAPQGIEGHLAFHRAEIPGQHGRLAGHAQRRRRAARSKRRWAFTATRPA